MQNNNIRSVHSIPPFLIPTPDPFGLRRRLRRLEAYVPRRRDRARALPQPEPIRVNLKSAESRIQSNSILFISMLLISPLSLANAIDSNDYWQCTTTDREDKQWVAKSINQRAAANTAYDACKKQSRLPATCKAAKEACEHFINGITDKPMWQCTALDQRGKPWVSNLYSNQDDAAIAAKAYCQESSEMPGSCFINMLTCKNRNSEK